VTAFDGHAKHLAAWGYCQGLVLICASWYIRGLFGISEGIHVSASASVAADKPFAFTKQIHV
jgi:hypothetical protein